MMPARVVLAACLVVAAAVFDCSPARADWAEAGAQYSCNKAMHMFELFPYETSSSDPPEGVELRPGFKQVTEEIAKITCVLGSHTLHAVIQINAPTEHNCMGAGSVWIVSIRSDGISLSPNAESLALACDFSRPVLISMRVTAEAQAFLIERCFGRPLAYNKADIDHCETQTVTANRRAN